MKKLLSILLVLALAFTMLAGCAKKESVNDPQIEEQNPEEGGEIVTDYINSEWISVYPWKADGYEWYFRSLDNMTYTFYDGEGKADDTILFWNYLEDSDDTVVLYNQFGGESGTMTFVEEGDFGYLKFSDGTIFRQTDKVMNGTYRCMINDTYLDGKTLQITASPKNYASEAQMSILAEGDVLGNPINEYQAIEVKSFKKIDDKTVEINDGEYTICKDENSNAWIIENSGEFWQYMGVCTLADNLEFSDPACEDGHHASFEECIKANDFIYPNITIENGIATKIEVVEIW